MPAGSQEFQEIAILRGRISKLEAHVQFLYKHLGVTFVPESVSTDWERSECIVRFTGPIWRRQKQPWMKSDRGLGIEKCDGHPE